MVTAGIKVTAGDKVCKHHFSN